MFSHIIDKRPLLLLRLAFFSCVEISCHCFVIYYSFWLAECSHLCECRVRRRAKTYIHSLPYVYIKIFVAFYSENKTLNCNQLFFSLSKFSFLKGFSIVCLFLGEECVNDGNLLGGAV